jgi:PAS domain S-box-containing protein
MTIEEILQETQRLRKENEILRKIDQDDFFNLSVDFLCTFFRRRFLQVSPSFVKALGYEKSYILSQNITAFLHPEDIDKTNKTILGFIGREGDLHEYQNRYRKADGSYFTVSWQIHIKDNGVAYAVGRDITKQKETQKRIEEHLEKEKLLTEEMKSQYEELLQNMEEMRTMQDFLKKSEEQARAAEKELQYKNNELDTFVYRASHDLRGPIATMLGLYEVMKLETANDMKPQEYLDIIQQSVVRLNTILDELMGLTKIKEMRIEKKEIDFNRLLNQIKVNLTDTPNYGLVSWQIALAVDSKVQTDENLLRIIIQNLAENALMFARLQRNEPYLRIEIENMPKTHLQIFVSDNGYGIKSEAIDKIFNMFYRASESSKGSGLGLYILKNALDKLNGTVVVKTEFGKGSSFLVTIPL